MSLRRWLAIVPVLLGLAAPARAQQNFATYMLALPTGTTPLGATDTILAIQSGTAYKITGVVTLPSGQSPPNAKGIPIWNNGLGLIDSSLGTQQFLINNHAALSGVMSFGTAAAPITAVGASVKLSRTENVLASVCTGGQAAADPECNGALAVYDIAGSAQTINAEAITAYALSTNPAQDNGNITDTDAIAVYGIGQSNGGGIGTGAVLKGVMGSSTASAVAAELDTQILTSINIPGASLVFPLMSNLLISTAGGSGGNANGSGILIYPVDATSRYDVGIGFLNAGYGAGAVGGSFKTAAIVDNSGSTSSLSIGGWHTQTIFDASQSVAVLKATGTYSGSVIDMTGATVAQDYIVGGNPQNFYVTHAGAGYFGSTLQAVGASTFASVTTTANVQIGCNLPTTSPAAALDSLYLCGNFSNANGEINLWNIDSTHQGGFNFRQLTGVGASTSLLDVELQGVEIGGHNASAVATNATGPFLYLSTSSGPPTGVPSRAAAGLTACEYDTSGHELWCYDQPLTTWKGLPTAGGSATFGTLTWGSGSVITGQAAGGTTATAITAVGANGNLLLQSASGGVVGIGGTTLANASLQVGTTASAVNQFVATPAVTGNAPTFLAGGSSADAAEPVTFGTLGTGNINFAIGGSTNFQAKITNTASAVDFFSLTGAATANPATIAVSAAGSDSNINIAVTSKGTGIVLLGQTICTASGSTPRTCNGQRGIVTTDAQSTAHNANSSYVINNSSVTTASEVLCKINSYSGTISTNGVPVLTQCIPGNGTITSNIFNADDTNALSGTIGIAFLVLN